MSTAQRTALTTHRRRRRRRRDTGVLRVEVQVPALDAALLRDLAAVLRGEPEAAQALRVQLRAAVARPRISALFDIFGSDLPDAYFDGVFEEKRRSETPRDVEL